MAFSQDLYGREMVPFSGMILKTPRSGWSVSSLPLECQCSQAGLLSDQN